MDIRRFKKLLKSYGFSFSRRGKGDHEIWQNQKGETFTVPVAQKRIKNGIVWQFTRQFTKEG